MQLISFKCNKIEYLKHVFFTLIMAQSGGTAMCESGVAMPTFSVGINIKWHGRARKWCGLSCFNKFWTVILQSSYGYT